MSKTLLITQGERKTLVITAQAIVYREQLPGAGTPIKFTRLASAGVLSYALPSAPVNAVVQAYLNGEALDTEVVGANVTLLGYDADQIEATDELRFFYTQDEQ